MGPETFRGLTDNLQSPCPLRDDNAAIRQDGKKTRPANLRQRSPCKCGSPRRYWRARLSKPLRNRCVAVRCGAFAGWSSPHLSWRTRNRWCLSGDNARGSLAAQTPLATKRLVVLCMVGFPRRYNLSTHLPWIGMRTAALGGAHVEYCRGISNPMGIKIGPTMTPEWLTGLCQTLNPMGEPGRLVLIHRMGAGQVEERLPPLIEAVRATSIPVLWICDPMHGNTETTASGVKTRKFDNIVAELEIAFRVHRQLGSYLGGVHFELTGEDVTECTGGARGLTDGDLARAYRSHVDPRLNYEQSLELAMRIAAYARSV